MWAPAGSAPPETGQLLAAGLEVLEEVLVGLGEAGFGCQGQGTGGIEAGVALQSWCDHDQIRTEGWECLQVKLLLEGSASQAAADGALLAAWRQLNPQLSDWGETWEGVTF